jgi:FkbM family methyltransferase
MEVPRFYRLKKLLFRCFPPPGPRGGSSSKWLNLRRRIFTLAFDDCHGYFSQFGQDKFIDQVLFEGERSGVFLDVGAYDGVTINNTYFLEQSRDWTGLCVEPLPKEFEKLQRARKAVCVNGCAGLEDGFVDFLQLDDGNEMLSGRVQTFELAHLERIKDATHKAPAAHDVVRVRAFALPGLLRAHGISHVDLLSLDTEGGELDLLKSLDLERLGVRAITIENQYRHPDIERYLVQAGYQLAAFMGCDEIYRRSPSTGAHG